MVSLLGKTTSAIFILFTQTTSCPHADAQIVSEGGLLNVQEEERCRR